MTTTESYQKLPDSYSSIQDCKASRFNTNPRYNYFNQVHFTAGDKEQFEAFRDSTNGDEPTRIINLEKNIFTYPLGTALDQTSQIQDIRLVNGIPKEYNEDVRSTDFDDLNWIKYRNLTTESVSNTFNYIFNKLKKGLFIKIKNNKLDVFLPFSKVNFTNEWGRLMKQPPNFATMTDFLIYCSSLSGYIVKPENINTNPSQWYANNSLIRYESPLGENDNDLSNFKDMLETLCSQREIPDIEFFLNKRDFPLLKRYTSPSEPYEEIFGKEKYPMISHNYERYSPILSMVTTDNNADIAMPTWEDWARVMSQSKPQKFFDGCRSYDYNFNTQWSKKTPTAVFRGASTGSGVTIDSNPRLKVSSLKFPPLQIDNKGPYIKLLDAGITKWNTRPRKTMNSFYLQTIDHNKLPFKLVNPLSPEEQSKYKYIINIDGHVSAFRLSLELSMGSVILLVDSKYKLWFKKYLIENFHYIRIKSDLSDLYEKIIWCRENDQKCEEIAKNAKIFYDKYLGKDGILDYMQILLTKLKVITGNYFYNTVKISKIIYNTQLSMLTKQIRRISTIEPNLIKINFESRNFYIYEALRMFYEKNGISYIDNNTITLHENQTKTNYVKVFKQNSFTTILVKKSNKTEELINETFIGLNCINKLISEIPNFRYIWGINFDFSKTESVPQIYCENIEGITLQKYIQNGCSIQELNGILILLCLTLAVSQERIGFVHYDLYPWNIIIKNIVKKIKIVYRFAQYVFEVETNIIPIIIDYGKAHVIYSGEHYGGIKPFETNRFQDCFSIIISCLHEMLINKNNKITKTVNDRIFYIANFFTNTDFHKDILKTPKELFDFLSINKKYDEMIFGSKYGLNDINPIELFFKLSDYTVKLDNQQRYILDIKQINYPSKIIYNIPFEIPLFYYDIISNIDPLLNIKKYVDKIKKEYNSLTDTNNSFFFINSCNKIHRALSFVIYFINKYCFNPKNDIENTCLSIINDLHKKQDSIKFNEEININYFNINKELTIANYTPETFSIPDKILTIFQSYPGFKNKNFFKKNEDMLLFKETFIFNILFQQPFILNNEDLFVSKYGKYMNIFSLAYTNEIANITTLKSISSITYKIDLKYLENLNNKPEKNIRTVKTILNLIT